jgi:hypothetical protein
MLPSSLTRRSSEKLGGAARTVKMRAAIRASPPARRSPVRGRVDFQSVIARIEVKTSPQARFRRMNWTSSRQVQSMLDPVRAFSGKERMALALVGCE